MKGYAFSGATRSRKTPTESVEIKNQYCPDFCIPKPKSLNVHCLLDYEENFSLCKLKQIKKMLH